jgi:hypothetical protein
MEKRSAPPVRMRPAHRAKLMNERTLTSNLAITQPKLTAGLRSSKSQFSHRQAGALSLPKRQIPGNVQNFARRGNTTAIGRAKNNTSGNGVLVFIGVYATCWLNNDQQHQEAKRGDEILANLEQRFQVSYSTPMAREMRTMTIVNEMQIWAMVSSLAQRASSGASVGPKVELCVSAIKR